MKKYILLLLLSIKLFSCSKNDNPEPDPVDPVVPTVLSKIVVLDTTKTAPNDTLSMDNFEYDVQGRISKQTLSTYNPATNNFQFRYSFTYFYNGSDTLASAATHLHINAPLTTRRKHFFTHNATGQLISDSTQYVTIIAGNYDSSVYTIRYQHHNYGFTDTRYSYFPGPVSVNTISTTVIKTDLYGNKISSFPSNQSGLTYLLHFDNQVNPLYKIVPLNLPHFNTPYFPNFHLPSYLEQKTNMSKVYTVDYDVSGNISNQVLTREYLTVYHENGMPASIRSRSTTSNPRDNYKYIYFYR